MKILLAGFASEAETTIRRIASSVFRCASLHHLPQGSRGTHGSLPQQSVADLRCQLCVIDTHGLGWSQHYPEHAARLEILLAGRAAVLLVPPNSAGDGFATRACDDLQTRIVLRRPACDAHIAFALRSAGAEADRLEAQADAGYLCRNIWIQQEPTENSLAGAAHRSSNCHPQRATNAKKNVFQSAMTALFA